MEKVSVSDAKPPHTPGRHHGYDSAMIQFTKSLSALAVEDVDLFLLHYPACWPGLCGGAGGAEGSPPVPPGTWQDSWRALESLVDKGLVRAIGGVPSFPLFNPPSTLTRMQSFEASCVLCPTERQCPAGLCTLLRWGGHWRNED